jgi:hypothetical protein
MSSSKHGPCIKALFSNISYIHFGTNESATTINASQTEGKALESSQSAPLRILNCGGTEKPAPSCGA